MKRNIVITGGAGFIGSHVVRSISDSQEAKWYVLRAAQPLKAVERMKELKAENPEWSFAFQDLRAPIRYVTPNERAMMKRDHPMVFNYIFVLARLNEISSFLSGNPELNTWVLNRRWKETDDHSFQLTAPSVPTAEIETFFRICDAIAKVEAHYVPFVDTTDSAFNPGDLVQVKGGFFDGHTGYLIDQKADMVVLQMMDGLGAPVKIIGATLEHANVRGVKNAKFSLFDDFFGRINPILQRMLANTHTGDDLAYAMHCLNESQKLTDLSSKLKSKQLVLQLICQTLLGNRKEMQKALLACDDFLSKVKDKYQRAMQAAYMYVCRPLPAYYKKAMDCLQEVPLAKKSELEEIIKCVQ